MPAAKEVIIQNRRSEDRLPDFAREGATIVSHLAGGGFLPPLFLGKRNNNRTLQRWPF